MSADHPLLAEIERRAAENLFGSPPRVDALPEGFHTWALDALRAGSIAVARMAGLLIAEHDPSGAEIAAQLVQPLARVADLPILRRGLPWLVDLLDDLTATAPAMPGPLADALVTVALEGALLHPCVVALMAHRDELERLQPRPGGALSHLVSRLIGVARQREVEHAVARQQFEALQSAATREASRLGHAPLVTVNEVEDAVRRLPVAGADLALFELVGTAPSDLAGLLMTLALVAAFSGGDHDDWADALRERAVRTIHELRALRLFELRVRLLDALITGSQRPKSRWFFARANSRMSVGALDAEALHAVLGDLDAAITAARRDSETDALADAAAARVRLVVNLLEPDRMALSHAEDLLKEVLSLDPSPERQATLFQSWAYAVRLHDPGAAATLFDDARSRLSPEDPMFWELAAESISARVGSGAASVAAVTADQLLGAASAAARTVEQAMFLAEASEAFFQASRPREDVRRLLRDALDVVRGRDPRLETSVHLRLARLARLDQDLATARRHVAHAWDHEDALDLATRIDALLVRSEVEDAAGNVAAARSDLDCAAAMARGTPDELSVRLMAALHDLREGSTPGDIDTLVLEAARGEVQQSRVQELVERLVCAHGERLVPRTLRTLRMWARNRGRRGVEAHISRLLGDHDGARETLRGALDATQDDERRLTYLAQLLVSLDDADLAERPSLADALERLLGERDDVPQVRMNLATALRCDGRGQPAELLRAWGHARRALPGLREGEVAHGHEVLALIVRDYCRATLGRSSAGRTALLEWLVEDHPVEPRRLAEIRLEVASYLLALGPCSPAAEVAFARDLLGHAEPTLGDTERARWVRRRCDWIEASISDVDDSPSPGEEVSPLDGAPQWLVRIAAGHAPPPDSPTLIADEIEDVVPLVLERRPDRADDLLAALLSWLPGLPARVQRVVQLLAADAVRGLDGWARTRAALETMPSLAVNDPADRALVLYLEGRRILDEVRAEIPPRDAAQRLAHARALLADAALLARENALPELFGILVTQGNAWRAPPDPDVGAALRCYADAEALDAADTQHAQLWKVTADALCDRGQPEDVREAARLLDRSIEVRRGWLRAESLVSAARAASEHPDLDEAERAARAATFLVEAARLDRVRLEPLLGRTLRHVARWAELRSQDARPHALLRELRSLFPGRAAELTLSAPAANRALFEHVRAMLDHPATAAFIRATVEPIMTGRSAPSNVAEAQSFVHARMADSHDDPEGLERRLASLETSAEPQAASGMATARVALIGALARGGRRSVDDLRRASDEALALVSDLDEGVVRAMLLRELARAWSPADPNDPVLDFDLAAALALRAIDAEGGETRASLDSLEHHARAVRYSSCRRLAEARVLYERIVDRARAEGQVDHLASALSAVAEIVEAEGSGPEASRLREALRLHEQAVAVARNPMVMARVRSQLAWCRTRSAITEQDVSALEAAERAFDDVDVAYLASQERRWLEANRQVCRAALPGCRAAQIERCRALVAASVTARERSTAQHNLACALLTGAITRERLAEAIRLLEEAAPARAGDARHEYETAILAGTALTAALDSDASRLPWPLAETWQRARTWLRGAVSRARELGPGSELARAALGLAALACRTPEVGPLREVSEEAWAALREATPFLLLDRATREAEVEMALETATALASRLAQDTVAIASTNVAFFLAEDRARLVLEWLYRAHAPLRRPLRARLPVPQGVSVALWQEWSGVLDRGDERGVVAILRRIRRGAPTFLVEDDQLEGVWQWLEERSGAIAVTVSLAHPISLAATLSVNVRGEPRVEVLGLLVPPPPTELEVLPDIMRGIVRGEAGALRAHDAAIAWARDAIVDPILRFYGEGSPTQVLWSPGPGLRGLAPGSLWDVPVSCAVGLDLALPDTTVSRPRSTLVALADPGASAQGLHALGGEGRGALESLVNSAAGRGTVRCLASAGPRFGTAVLQTPGAVREAPASASDILAEARAHDVVVLVAHGEAPRPERAALLCVDAQGRLERLDVAALGRQPDAFRGAIVILLSCEAGQVGDAIAEPGGVAGTLLAAGARVVVAPLWPVRLDAAVEVARSVLEAIRRGDDVAVAVARGSGQEGVNGPSLGRAPPASIQRESAALQRRSFVTWVG